MGAFHRGVHTYSGGRFVPVEGMPGWDLDVEYICSCESSDDAPNVFIHHLTLCTPHRRIPLELADIARRRELEELITAEIEAKLHARCDPPAPDDDRGKLE